MVNTRPLQQFMERGCGQASFWFIKFGVVVRSFFPTWAMPTGATFMLARPYALGPTFPSFLICAKTEKIPPGKQMGMLLNTGRRFYLKCVSARQEVSICLLSAVLLTQVHNTDWIRFVPLRKVRRDAKLSWGNNQPSTSCPITGLSSRRPEHSRKQNYLPQLKLESIRKNKMMRLRPSPLMVNIESDFSRRTHNPTSKWNY